MRTGSVFRRASDSAWIAQISTGPRGSRKTHSRSARTRSEALAKLTQLRADLAAAPRRELLLWQIVDLLRQYTWGRLWWETHPDDDLAWTRPA